MTSSLAANGTMSAVRVHQYGGPDVLKVETVSRPSPAAGEILVKVHAAGVLPVETYVRRGAFAQGKPLAAPYIPGSAFAGIVAAVGDNVTEWQVGDAICGRSPNGTYAEYTCVPITPPVVNASLPREQVSKGVVPLAAMPQSLSFDEAATLSGGATTAWTTLFEDGDIQPGQRVLIHAAAGGVGLFAVQFAKWRGAFVVATTSTTNVDFVRKLGADQVIDYTREPFDRVAEPVDFVLDAVGGDTLQRSLRLVKRGGLLVSIMAAEPESLNTVHGIQAINNQALPTSEALRSIVQLIDAGHVKPHVRATFPLEAAPAAHDLCETGHGRGRIVLHIAD